MNIIDSHFHLFKSESAGLMAQGGQSLLGYNGILSEAKEILKKHKIGKIMAIAVVPVSLMRRSAKAGWPSDITPELRNEMSIDLESKLNKRLFDYNSWLCSTAQDDSRISPVIAADPTLDKEFMIGELESKIDSFQIKAVKIHPTVNGLYPGDKGYMDIYRLAEEKGLTVISHGGVSFEDPEGKYCSPQKFRDFLDNFPKLKMVIAHLAYPHVEDMIELMIDHQNLYTDLSFVLGNSPLSDKDFCKIISSIGAGRVLFGSDFPWSDPEKDIDRLLGIGLTDRELELVTRENAERLFRLGG